MESLLTITDISSVFVSDVNIMNNYASQYLLLTGNSNGNLEINDTVIDNNQNKGLPDNNLIEANNFENVIIVRSTFHENSNGTHLFAATLDSDFLIENSEMTGNIEMKTLIDLNIDGDIDIKNCNFDDNDVEIAAIYGITNQGILTMTSTNITNIRSVATVITLCHNGNHIKNSYVGLSPRKK